MGVNGREGRESEGGKVRSSDGAVNGEECRIAAVTRTIGFNHFTRARKNERIKVVIQSNEGCYFSMK